MTVDAVEDAGRVLELAVGADRAATAAPWRAGARRVGAPADRLVARTGYPDEERTVIDCISVVMDEEIEHYRFAVRDLAIPESR